MINVTLANFKNGSRSARTRSLYQYDYGQILRFEGVELPSVYEVHFSNADDGGESTTSLGDENGVVIPDIYLTTGDDVYAWMFLHEGTEDGEVRYKVIIPVKKRAKPSDVIPPVQQDVITQAIAVLNDAIRQTSEDVETTGQYAQDASQSASNALASEQNAKSSEDNALAYAQRAETAELNADASATYANQSANDAALSADSANTSKRQAETAADRAEQAAATSGYMFFNINAVGELIYERTANVLVDFAITNGYMFMEVV